MTERQMGRTRNESYTDRQRRLERQQARAAGVKLDGSPRLPTGPARKPASERLDHPTTILLTADLREAVGAAAYTAHQSVGDWLRTAAIEKLTRGDA